MIDERNSTLQLSHGILLLKRWRIRRCVHHELNNSFRPFNRDIHDTIRLRREYETVRDTITEVRLLLFFNERTKCFSGVPFELATRELRLILIKDRLERPSDNLVTNELAQLHDILLLELRMHVIRLVPIVAISDEEIQEFSQIDSLVHNPEFIVEVNSQVNVPIERRRVEQFLVVVGNKLIAHRILILPQEVFHEQLLIVVCHNLPCTYELLHRNREIPHLQFVHRTFTVSQFHFLNHIWFQLNRGVG